MARRAFGGAPLPLVNGGFARLLPGASIMLAAVVTILPLRIPGDATLAPAFALMATYHWTIYRPDLLPPLVLFAVGISEDLLAGGPAGVSALLLLLARAAVLGCRHYIVDRPFPFVWAGFTIVAGAAMLGLWALHCALELSLFGLRNTIFRLVLTVAVFPVASFLLGRAQRALTGPL